MTPRQEIAAEPTAEEYDAATAAYERAFAAVEAGDLEDAEQAFAETVSLLPHAAEAWTNLGQVRQSLGLHVEALAAYDRLVALDPEDWQGHSKRVQLLYALDQPEKAAEVRQVVRDLYAADKVDAEYFCVEQYEHAGERVMAFEYFDLVDPRAVRYVFYLLEGDNDVKHSYSFGSYERTTKIAREMGDIGAEERSWHLDGYGPDGSHQTFGFWDEELSYEKVRELVAAILEGNFDPISESRVQPP